MQQLGQVEPDHPLDADIQRFRPALGTGNRQLVAVPVYTMALRSRNSVYINRPYPEEGCWLPGWVPQWGEPVEVAGR